MDVDRLAQNVQILRDNKCWLKVIFSHKSPSPMTVTGALPYANEYHKPRTRASQ